MDMERLHEEIGNARVLEEAARHGLIGAGTYAAALCAMKAALGRTESLAAAIRASFAAALAANAALRLLLGRRR